MPSPAWRGWPRRAGCGGDTYRQRSGFVEWYQPLVRVGDDALIVPKVRQQSNTFVLTDSARKVSGRCGHRPLRGWGAFYPVMGPLIRHALRRATFPVGEGCLRRGLVHRGPSWTSWGPLHTRHGCAVPPSPSRRGPLPRVISPAKSVSKSSAMPWGVRPWPRPHMSLV